MGHAAGNVVLLGLVGFEAGLQVVADVGLDPFARVVSMFAVGDGHWAVGAWPWTNFLLLR